jgi:LmbE family N-acetylglucosaminyl deacetylase
VRVLAIGAHPDDIELGCGGALLAHRRRGDDVTMLVMTTGEQGPQASRSRMLEQEDAAAALGARLCWGEFRDGAVPAGPAAVDALDALMRDTACHLVYTHAGRDTHQDHRATAVATLAAGRRSQRILHYEAPTTIGFAPTLFVEMAEHVEGKLDLLRAHMSQVLKNGLVDLEAVEAQARFRGFAGRARYAEGFEAERFVLDLSMAGPAPLLVAEEAAAIPA